MTITLNGEIMTVSDQLSVGELIRQKNIPQQATVAELNSQILTDFDTRLKDGDVLELIRLVGGG